MLDAGGVRELRWDSFRGEEWGGGTHWLKVQFVIHTGRLGPLTLKFDRATRRFLTLTSTGTFEK